MSNCAACSTTILLIGNRQELNKMCDKLINFEITRDDLIKADESEVDSTVEGTPVKKLKLDTTSSVQQKPKLKKSEKKLQAEVKAKAAKLKAKEIFEARDV